MSEFARVSVVDVKVGGGERRVWVEFDEGIVGGTVRFDEVGGVGLGGLMIVEDLAERN